MSAKILRMNEIKDGCMPGHASVFYFVLWPLAAMRVRVGRDGLFGREENLAVAEAGGYIFVAELRIGRGLSHCQR